MKHNNIAAQYRQGDVMIEAVTSIPEGAVKKEGPVILAFGEVTGHHHSFLPGHAERMEADDREYFNVRGAEINMTLPAVRQWQGQVMVNHPEFGMMEFSLSDVESKAGRVHIAGHFGLLVHQEHSTHAVPAGSYVGSSGGKVRQCIYTPAAIVNVAD